MQYVKKITFIPQYRIVDFRPYNVSAETLFRGSDLNHDGTFTRVELEESFKKYDENGKSYSFSFCVVWQWTATYLLA